MQIFLYGPIASFMWDQSAVGVRQQLHAAAPNEPIFVHVHSPGGDPMEVGAIRALLEAHSGPVTVVIDGLAASAAAQLLTTRGAITQITRGGFVMLHETRKPSGGTADELTASAAAITKIDLQTAEEFVTKTGKSLAVVQAWMAAETWFTATEAVEAGLVDSVVGETPQLEQRFNLQRFTRAPQQLGSNYTTPRPVCQTTSMDPIQIRQRLNLSATATDDEVYAALDAKAAAPPVQLAPPVAAPVVAPPVATLPAAPPVVATLPVVAPSITATAAPVAPVAPAVAPVNTDAIGTMIRQAVTDQLAVAQAPEAHALAVQSCVERHITALKIRPADRALAIAACGTTPEQLTVQNTYWESVPALVATVGVQPLTPAGGSMSPMLQLMTQSAGLKPETVQKLQKEAPAS